MAQGQSLVSLSKFASQARGKTEVVQHNVLPDTDSPGVALTQRFEYQSYFDDTLLEKAILLQSPNEPIINSTKKSSNVSGYSFGLHPSSQSPVAVRPIVGGQAASAQAVILKPGQIYRPHGRLGKPGHFSGFEWGLPYGWLGGGVCTLYVFPSPDADVSWPGDAELLFHRQRMKILAPADVPAAALKNWPLRFPWTQALRGSTSIPQKGAAIVSISNPTRVLLSLRLNLMTTADTMRMLIHESNDMDLDSAGAVIAAGVRFDEFTWGIYGASGAANMATQFPVKQYDGPVARLAADDGGVCLVDMAGGDLTNAFVDVCRYGRL